MDDGGRDLGCFYWKGKRREDAKVLFDAAGRAGGTCSTPARLLGELVLGSPGERWYLLEV